MPNPLTSRPRRSRVRLSEGSPHAESEADKAAWQQLAAERRQNDLRKWATTLVPLAEAVGVLLNLLRDNGVPQRVAAPAGQYQQRLPEGKTYHLLRLRIDESLGLVPEISGHRLMVSVRLMRPDEEGSLKPVADDASFEMALCA